MFKPGDKVVCIDNQGIATIAQMYQKFTICSVSNYGKYVSIDKDREPSLRTDRFELDIKEQRKLKLEKICLNQEIK